MTRSVSYDEFLVSHIGFVRRLAAALVRDRDIAEEVVQETMLAALKQGPSAAENLQGWLRSVLRNRVALHFRSETRRSRREARSELAAAGAETTDPAEYSLLQTERSVLVAEALRELREPYRSVVVLRYVDEKTPPQIAQELGRPIATVNTQLQRGLQILRAELDRRSGGDRRIWARALVPLAAPILAPPAIAGVSKGMLALLAAASVLVIGLLASQWLLSNDSIPAAREAAGAAPLAVADARLATDERVSTDPAPDPLPGLATADAGDAKQGFRVRVLAHGQPFAGARVTWQAPPTPEDAARALRRGPIAVVGPDGQEDRFTIGPGGDPVPVPRSGEPAEIEVTPSTGTTGPLGEVEIDMPPASQLEFRVTAPGFLTQRREIEAALGEVAVFELLPAAGLRVLRNRFAKGAWVSLLLLRHEATDQVVQASLESGQDQLELGDLRPGRWRLQIDAVTPDGAFVGHRSASIQLLAGSLQDLELPAGDHRLEVRIAPEAQAERIEQMMLYRHDQDSKAWPARRVDVRDGVAIFESLQPGPMTLQALTRTHSLALHEYSLAASPDRRATVVYQLPAGGLRVLHPQRSDEQAVVLLARVPDGDQPWRSISSVEFDPGRTTFHSLAPGSYRLWTQVGGALRGHAVEVADALAELTIDPDPSPGSRLVVRAGAGVDREQPVDLCWNGLVLRQIVLQAGAASVDLQPGDYELRYALEGLGTGRLEFGSTAVGALELTEPQPAVPVRLVGSQEDPPEGEWWVLQAPGSGSGSGSRSPKHRALAAERIDRATARCPLRPGRYVVEDAHGRRAAFELAPRQTSVALVWDLAPHRPR